MAIWHRIMHSDEEIQLQTISFKTTEQANIHWLSKGKEFFLNGKHYDIVKTEKTDERCTYLCIADEEEDELFDSFDKYNTSDDLSVTKNKSAIKTICPVYPCFFTNKEKLIFYLTILSVFDTNATLNYYPLVYMEVNHPPPSFI